jgi:N-acyl-D-amino-acid deacylase
MAAFALTQADGWAQSGGTGGFLSRFFAFDREIQQFMSARHVPGGALAVVKDRRLVYTRGYGWADRENKIPVKPASLFRIASISKPFTAVALLKLVEDGKLGLEARVWDLLGSGTDAWRPPAEGFDQRWKQITIRHLLQHTGGWDRDRSFDPMFRPREIAKTLGVASPPAPRDVIRYMLGQPLDFDPGTRYAYSNFGYCVLGRVIEKIAGTSYEKLVQEKVLAPIGIKRMRLGASLAEKGAEGEVRYYTPREETADSLFGIGKVPWPYGGFCLESMDAHGGWIASAVDLARFAATLHDPQHCPLLKPETIRIMHAPPEPPVSRNSDRSLKDHYYACGWQVRPVGQEGKANYWHTGSLPGTYTLLVRRHDGVSWAILFNQRSDDEKLPDSEIDPALHRAANAVNEWPKFDLFRQEH